MNEKLSIFLEIIAKAIGIMNGDITCTKTQVPTDISKNDVSEDTVTDVLIQYEERYKDYDFNAMMQESDQTYVLIIYRREIPRGPKKILTPEIVKKLKEQHI
jgi:hypothetical protein